MSKSSEFNKLASIVDQFIIENSLGNGWFNLCLAYACRGLREVKLDMAQDVKTALLDVTDRKTAVLPDSFVDWTKVAVRRGQYFITLGINAELNELPRTTSSPSVTGLLSQHLPNGLEFSAYGGFSFFNFNGGSFDSFGSGLPSKGYFKVVDRGSCKELLIDYDYGFKQVYLEYITDGFDPCSETVVHPYLYDYVLKYIEMKFEKKNNPKATAFSISEAEKDVFWAEKRIRARRNNLDPQTLINLSRQETRLTPHI